MIFYSILAQFWKFINNKTLKNKDISFWEFGDKEWSVPPEGNEGFVQDKRTGQVLTLEKLNPNEKSKLILKNESITGSDNQKWIRSSPDSDGWFTLKNPSSNEFLQPIAQHECKYN